MLTTQDSQKIRESVATDLNANIEVPSPKVRHLSPEAALLLDKSIIARPLNVPSVSDIKVKNFEYRYRWVNRDGMGGQIYQQRRAQGFLNASNEDVEVLGGDVQTKDGEIRAGDLILMKIQCDRYDAAIKSNMQQAMRLERTKGAYLKSGSGDVFSDEKKAVGNVTEETAVAKGVQQFIPKDVQSIVEDSVHSGRVLETRRTVESLKEQER